jgi:hypothetical protein
MKSLRSGFPTMEARQDIASTQGRIASCLVLIPIGLLLATF